MPKSTAPFSSPYAVLTAFAITARINPYVIETGHPLPQPAFGMWECGLERL